MAAEAVEWKSDTKQTDTNADFFTSFQTLLCAQVRKDRGDQTIQLTSSERQQSLSISKLSLRWIIWPGSPPRPLLMGRVSVLMC